MSTIEMSYESLVEASPIWWSIVGFFSSCEEAAEVAACKQWASKGAFVIFMPDATGDKWAVAYNPAADKYDDDAYTTF